MIVNLLLRRSTTFCPRMARDDLGVDVVAVERAVSGERGHRPVDPVEQGAGLERLGIMAGQRRRDDPAGVGVRGETKLLPSPTPPGAVLLDQPFAGAAEFQARAVHQQMHRRNPGLWSRDLQSLGSPAEGAVVGNREVKAEQADDGPIRPSVWRSGQAEDGSQGQGRHDGERRVVRLSAGGRARLGPPSRDRRVGEPDRETAALTQGRIILRPVRHPMLGA